MRTAEYNGIVIEHDNDGVVTIHSEIGHISMEYSTFSDLQYLMAQILLFPKETWKNNQEPINLQP